MPWLIQDQTCPACEGRHDFCTDGMPAEGARYTFTCPKGDIGAVVTFNAAGGFMAATLPRGIVRAHEVPGS
jgi:hypothetical protein